MPIYLDSYRTTEGSLSNTKSIETAIKQAIIKDAVDSVSFGVNARGNFRPLFITGSYPSEVQIPPFTHPIIVFYQGVSYLCTDLRLFIRKDTPPDDIQSGVRNKSEVDFSVSRSVLNLAWATGSILEIKNNLRFAAKVYSTMVAQTVARNFNLDFRDETLVTIAAEYFYRTLFIGEKINEQHKEDLAIHTIKSTNAPGDLVMRVYDQFPEFNNIAEWCQGLHKVLENPRLDKFSFGVLLEMLRNSWHYTNAKPIMAVALEHPPTFCAMVYAALVDRGLKNSQLARVAENVGKRGPGEEYVRNYVQLVHDYRTLSTESRQESVKDLSAALDLSDQDTP